MPIDKEERIMPLTTAERSEIANAQAAKPEERKSASAKRTETMGPAALSAASAKGRATLGEEGCSAAAAKAKATLGEEGRRAAVAKAKRTMGPAARSAASAKGHVTRRINATNKEAAETLLLLSGRSPAASSSTAHAPASAAVSAIS
ncbi:hypothetical protein ACFWNO_47090, partial [Streptomyces sp. NPDC058394]